MDMTANSNSVGQEKKFCSKCGIDISDQRRFRDAAGNRYCVNCFSKKSAAPTNTIPETVKPDESLTFRSCGLVPRLTCPHCWHVFGPQELLWVAAHSELMGDPVLGPEKAQRFLPSRFTVAGQAIDARGVSCQQLACPRCHLIMPRSAVEAEPLFLSIVGGPKTGKSYFLSAMTWELRKQLPSSFAIAFGDADTVSNQQINEYEATLFLPEDPEKLVAIAKTEESGDLYDQANLGGHIVSLPRPFLFNVRPTQQHINAQHGDRIGRVICLYDNAGESFQPGKDTVASPATQHLAKSRVLMFLFDPTQDPRFRDKCRQISQDPQLSAGRGTQRQETLLAEAALRVRRYANLPSGKKHDSPLLVIVPKSDVWGSMLNEDLVTEPVLPTAIAGQPAAVDIQRIERVSHKLRAMLLNETPELVAAAEDFCQCVLYIPVSALGRSPEEADLPQGGKGLFIRPKNISPRWAAVPVLYMFAKWTTGLIAGNGTNASSKRPVAVVSAPR
jgi:hypothetical protein